MADDAREHDEPEAGDGREPPPPASEWAVAALGALLLVATLSFLLLEAFRGEEAPPAPALSVLEVARQDTQHLVRVRIVNRGRQAAAGLRVVGRLKDGERVVEESETEFDYVPGRSSHEAGLFFDADPARYRIELSARSYRRP